MVGKGGFFADNESKRLEFDRFVPRYCMVDPGLGGRRDQSRLYLGISGCMVNSGSDSIIVVRFESFVHFMAPWRPQELHHLTSSCRILL